MGWRGRPRIRRDLGEVSDPERRRERVGDEFTRGPNAGGALAGCWCKLRDETSSPSLAFSSVLPRTMAGAVGSEEGIGDAGPPPIGGADFDSKIRFWWLVDRSFGEGKLAKSQRRSEHEFWKVGCNIPVSPALRRTFHCRVWAKSSRSIHNQSLSAEPIRLFTTNSPSDDPTKESQSPRFH